MAASSAAQSASSSRRGADHRNRPISAACHRPVVPRTRGPGGSAPGEGQGRGEAGGVPARAPRLVCCWALSGRDLVKKSLGIIGLFGANRGELVYARNMFEELRDALENLVVTAEPDAVAELHRLHGILEIGRA